MADSSEEKTRDPTDKRLREAREEGQIAQSRDLTMLFAIVSILLYYSYSADTVFFKISDFFDLIMFSIGHNDMDLSQISRILFTCGQLLLVVLLIPIVIGAVVSLIFNIIQLRGITINKKAFVVKFDKFNPVTNLKEIFSKKNFLKFFKYVLEITIMSIVAYTSFKSKLPNILKISQLDVTSIVLLMLDILSHIFIILFFVHFVFVIFDYLLEYMHTKKQLMMSESDIKQEYKSMEGDPEVKGERKRLHRELLEDDEMGMMSDATMVLANPTHIAVVIKYRPKESPLPLIILKAKDDKAQVIFKLAKGLNIPIIRDIWLARQLFSLANVGQTVPSSLAKHLGDVIGKNLHLMPVLEQEFKQAYYEKMKSTEVLDNPFKKKL